MDPAIHPDRRVIGRAGAWSEGAQPFLQSLSRHRLAGWPRTTSRTFFIVGLSAAVPLVLLSILFGYRTSTQQRQAAEYEVTRLVDGAAHRLNAILASEIEAAQPVPRFRSLASADLAHLYEHLQRLHDRHADWQTIALARPSGERLLDLGAPLGSPALPPVPAQAFAAVAARDTAMIGGILAPGTLTAQWSIALYAPVRADNALRYIAVIALSPERFSKTLSEAGLPDDWRGVILDHDGRVVARTANSRLPLGGQHQRPPAPAGPLSAVRQGRAPDGQPIYWVSASIPSAEWSVVWEVPRATLDKSVDDAWHMMLIASGGSLVLAAVLASLVARDIGERRRMEIGIAENVLRVSEAWRLVAVEAADIGTWHWDFPTNDIRSCERCRKLLGLEREVRDHKTLQAAIRPDHRKAVRLAMAQSLKRTEPFEVAFPVLLANGRSRWLRLCGRPLYDDRRRPIGSYGALLDIDAEKKAAADHRRLLSRLDSAQEDERRRIARDLHDRAGQSLTGLSLGLKRLELADASPERARAYDELKAMVLEISRDIHRAALELRPTALDDIGLKDALEAFVGKWAASTGIAVEAYFDWSDGIRLPRVIETNAFRIVGELFTNIARHAAADSVSITMSRRADMMSIVVEDNGRGFDETASRHTPQRHLGLLGIRERLEPLGGELQIETAPGAGTTVYLRIPVTVDDSEGDET